LRRYHLQRILASAASGSWRWLTARPSSASRVTTDGEVRAAVKVRLGLPILPLAMTGPECVMCHEERMDPLGSHMRCCTRAGCKCVMHESIKHAACWWLRGVSEPVVEELAAQHLRPDLMVVRPEGGTFLLDVSVVEGLGEGIQQMWESRGLSGTAKREAEKVAKYEEACAGLGRFGPLVMSPFGALGKASREFLAEVVGARCPDGCSCEGHLHGRKEQKEELRRVLQALSFAAARSHQLLALQAWTSWLATEFGGGGRERRRAARETRRLQRWFRAAQRQRWRVAVGQRASPFLV